MQRLKKWFLIVSSYLFYALWNVAHTAILLGVTLITFFSGRLFSSYQGVARRRVLGVSLGFLALLPLLVYKYYNFLVASGVDLLQHFGLSLHWQGLNWAIPIGISFFTFQAYGYMMDVYYGRIKEERSFTNYLLFVSFFPQLASGPISKASELLPQFRRLNPFRYEQAVCGLRYFLWGLFLKIAIANRAGEIVDTVFGAQGSYAGLDNVWAALCYTLQIYSDFAGYSYMAVGVGKLLGFDLINNFQRPYFASSVTDFWRRWHISFSRWLRDYVYIPLGGNRCSKLRNYCNIFITFFVSGLWHGANWTFVFWGVLHGIYQIIEKMLDWHKLPMRRPVRLLRIFFTFVVVAFAWIFFRSPSLGDALQFIGNMGHWNGGLVPAQSAFSLFHLFICTLPLIGVEVMQEFYALRFQSMMQRKAVRWAGYSALVVMLLLFGNFDGASFIYVSF